MSETPTDRPLASPIHRPPPPRRRSGLRTAIWIIAAILLAVLVGWMLTPHGAAKGSGGRHGGAGAGPGGPGGRNATVVGLATAVKGDIPITFSALGTVTSEATITVQSQIAGVLTKIDFIEGQTVHKGQLLAEVDTRPYLVALAQAQGQIARDQASLGNAQLDLKRYRTLAAQDSISGQQVDAQAALVKQDEGVVKTDEASVASARLNLTYCHITAPVSGRVGLRQVDAGNYITSGLTNGIVVITQFNPIDVVFSLPEDDVPQITARISQGASLPVTALDRTGVTTLGQGVLATLDNQIDTSTGTIKAKARFDNAAETLFPNQFVNVTLLVDTMKDAVVVPTAAVRHGSSGDYVFVLDQDPVTGENIARQATIKVGPSQGDLTSIASGINVGDQVITDGGDRLTPGGPVVLPGQALSAGHAKPNSGGFFGWLAGLFGHKPAAADASTGAAPGGSDSGSAGTASAGGGGYGGGGGGGGHGGGMARMQAMLAQLDLTPDQKSKIDAITTDLHQKVQASGDDPDARRTAMRAGMSQISGLLTPAQKSKMAALRAAARAAGGAASPASAPTSDQPPPVAASSTPAAPAPSPQPSQPPPNAGGPPAGDHTGGHGGGGRGALFAILDDDQKAKAKAIFDAARASGDPDAFQKAHAQIEALLRPDQEAKLQQMRAARAQNGGAGGGGDQ